MLKLRWRAYVGYVLCTYASLFLLVACPSLCTLSPLTIGGIWVTLLWSMVLALPVTVIAAIIGLPFAFGAEPIFPDPRRKRIPGWCLYVAFWLGLLLFFLLLTFGDDSHIPIGIYLLALAAIVIVAQPLVFYERWMRRTASKLDVGHPLIDWRDPKFEEPSLMVDPNSSGRISDRRT